jgi:hypothetical protein
MDTTAIEYTYEIFRSDEYMDTCLNKYLDKKKGILWQHIHMSKHEWLNV